jgi:hypothetical protein
LVANGYRELVDANSVGQILTVQSASANAIYSSSNTIINNTWADLVSEGYTTTWNAEDEEYTRINTATLLQSIVWVLETANEKPMIDFAKGLFTPQDDPTVNSVIGLITKVYTPDKEDAFLHSYEYIRDQINALPGVSNTAETIVTSLFASLEDTIINTQYIIQPSIITAVGHIWTAVMSGVALTKIPPAFNLAKIQDSIQELDQGLVIASGQDDQGSALFVGGMTIDADTGELGGPPFESAVNRIATKTVISRSY